MGIVKVVIPDDVEEILRKTLPARKGAMSEFVTEAVVEKLKKMGVNVNAD